MARPAGFLIPLGIQRARHSREPPWPPPGQKRKPGIAGTIHRPDFESNSNYDVSKDRLAEPPVNLDARFARYVERLHRLGPRALLEMLREIGAERLIMTVIEDRVARYAEPDPLVLREIGADQMPPPPLHLVPSSRQQDGGDKRAPR